jgi:2,4-dienoyl-CoA reductase-like NADH-dependent reductase (Old Yellow Enzyme family)
MPLQETLDTFSYFISEADKLGLAYITLARYSEALDPVIDGTFLNLKIFFFLDTNFCSGKRRATPHDVVASYRHLIKNSKVFVNGSVLPEEGVELVKSGKADVVSIGFNYLTHPDFAKRVLYNKPLDNQPNFPHIYGAGNSDLHVGYTDYPAAKYDVVAHA